MLQHVSTKERPYHEDTEKCSLRVLQWKYGTEHVPSVGSAKGFMAKQMKYNHKTTKKHWILIVGIVLTLIWVTATLWSTFTGCWGWGHLTVLIASRRRRRMFPSPSRVRPLRRRAIATPVRGVDPDSIFEVVLSSKDSWRAVVCYVHAKARRDVIRKGSVVDPSGP